MPHARRYFGLQGHCCRPNIVGTKRGPLRARVRCQWLLPLHWLCRTYRLHDHRRNQLRIDQCSRRRHIHCSIANPTPPTRASPSTNTTTRASSRYPRCTGGPKFVFRLSSTSSNNNASASNNAVANENNTTNQCMRASFFRNSVVDHYTICRYE